MRRSAPGAKKKKGKRFTGGYAIPTQAVAPYVTRALLSGENRLLNEGEEDYYFKPEKKKSQR